MTQLSAFGTLGNGATGPVASTSFGGAFLCGLMFKVTQPGYFLYNYRYWRADSAQPASASFALWLMTSATAGTEQGTTARVSTTTMVTGQWNDAVLASPFALTQNAVYMIVAGVTGNFNDTHTEFGTGGPYAGGIVNSALTIFSAPTAHGGTNEAWPAANAFQGTFSTAGSNPAANMPLSDDSDANFWVDLVVGPAPGTSAPAGVAAVSALAHNATVTTSGATSAPAGVAAVSAQAPAPSRAVQVHAGVATVGAASGASSLTMKLASTDGNGVQTWTSNSPMNSGGNHAVRIKPPSAPPAGMPHSFLYCLPVSTEGDGSFGSALDICVTAGTPDARNVTLVEPTWGNSPWYADHATDPALRHESAFMAIVNWVKSNLATQPFAVQGTEAHHLIGFSKSGIGGLDLLFNWPSVFGKGAFWDWPADMNAYNRFDPDSTSAYGSQAAFLARYMPDATFVSNRKGPFLIAVSRQWHTGGVLYTSEVADFNTLLAGQSVPHQGGSNNGNGSHVFDSSWVLPGVASILPSTGDPGAGVTAPNATASVAAHAGAATVGAAVPGAAATVVTGTSAPAGAAAVAAASTSARIAVTTPAGVADVAASASAPRSAISAEAGIAAVQALTVSASPSGSASALAGVATVAAGAAQPAAAVAPAAGAATVHATALSAPPSGSLSASAGAAAVGAGVAGALAAAGVMAGSAQVLAAAPGITPPGAVLAHAGIASVSSAAAPPSPGVAVATAVAAVQALAPGGVTARGVSALAGVAAVQSLAPGALAAAGVRALVAVAGVIAVQAAGPAPLSSQLAGTAAGAPRTRWSAGSPLSGYASGSPTGH